MSKTALVFALLIATRGTVHAEARDESLERFRGEFLQFLTDLRELAPSAFGAGPGGPERGRDLLDQVRAMAPEQLRRIQAAFARAGAWQQVPGALGTLRQTLNVATSPEDEARRQNVGAVLTLMQLAPDATLAQLGTERGSVSAAQQKLEAMTPQQFGATGDRLSRVPSWEELSSNIRRALPPETQDAVLALARQGGLTREQRRELEGFRDELTAFFGALELRPASDPATDADRDRRLAQLHEMTAEMLYLFRERMEADPRWRSMRERLENDLTEEQRRDLRTLAELGPLADESRAQLEGLRSDVLAFRADLVVMAPQLAGAPHWAQVEQFTPHQLALMQRRLDQLPGWRSLSTYHSIMQDQAALMPAAVPTGTEELKALEGVRAELRGALARLAGTGAVRSAEQANQRLAQLPAVGLAVFQNILERTPPARRGDMTSLLASFLGEPSASPTVPAAVDRPSLGSCFTFRDLGHILNGFIDLAIPDGSLPWGVPLPTGINFDCIGLQFKSIADEVDRITGEIAGLADDVITGIEDFFNTNLVQPLETLAGVFEDFGKNVVHFLGSFSPLSYLQVAADGFGALVQAMDSDAGAAVAAIRVFLEVLRQPFLRSLNEAVGNPGTDSRLLDELDLLFFSESPPLGIVPIFVSALCAPGQFQAGACRQGLRIPLIGDVGTERSVSACKVITMEVEFFRNLMPEEGWDGLKLSDIALNSFVHRLNELCAINDYVADGRRRLEEEEAQAATNLFRSNVLQGHEDIKNLVGASAVGLGTQIANAQGAITQRVDLAESRLNSSLLDVKMMLESLGQASEARILEAIDGAQTTLSDAIAESRDKELRLKIEQALIHDGKAQVASFQLPESVGGHLEIVREVLVRVLDMKMSVGVNVDRALRELDLGDAARLALDFAKAYEHYRKAYQALVK